MMTPRRQSSNNRWWSLPLYLSHYDWCKSFSNRLLTLLYVWDRREKLLKNWLLWCFEWRLSHDVIAISTFVAALRDWHRRPGGTGVVAWRTRARRLGDMPQGRHPSITYIECATHSLSSWLLSFPNRSLPVRFILELSFASLCDVMRCAYVVIRSHFVARLQALLTRATCAWHIENKKS